MSGDKATQNRFVFLDVLRGVAPVLVIYSHVVALFLDPNDIETGVVNLLNEQARDPLRLEQHMGHLAVVLFFLVSGFIITQVGTQESHREFAIKRLFRVYPLLIFTVGLTAVLSIFNLEVLQTGQYFEITLQSVLTNFTLANYLMVPQIVLVGVAWTLVIEIIFYLLVLSLLAVLRRWAWLAILIELTLVLTSMLLARELGPNFFLLAINLSFLPVVLLGQVTWAVWSGRIPLWLGTVFGFACWILYVLADMRSMGRLDEAYSSTFALGFAIFIAVLLAEQRLRPNKYVSYFADRSYSLYLLHGPLAFPVMEGLNGVLPLPLIILAGLALTVGATELTFRYIEQPGQRIGRKLSKRFRLKELAARKAPPEPEYEDEYEDDDEYDDDYYEDEYEPEPVHAAPIGSRRLVVTGDLWDSPPEPPPHAPPPQPYGPPAPYPPPRQPQYGEPRYRGPHHGEPLHREQRNGQPQYGWPQDDEPQRREVPPRQPRHREPQGGEQQNGDPQRHSRQNGESLHRWPQSSQPQHREPQNNEHDPQNGESQYRGQHNGELRHHETLNSEPRRRETQPDWPQHHEPQNGEPQRRRPQAPHREPRHREPRNGQPQHGWPQEGEGQNGESRHHRRQNGESRHREPQDRQPQYGEPRDGQPQHREPPRREPHREPRHGEPRHDESRHGESRHGESRHGEPRRGEPRHRQPARQEPPPYPPVRRSPERAHRYRDE